MAQVAAGAVLSAVAALILREMKGSTPAALCTVGAVVLLVGLFLQRATELVNAVLPHLNSVAGEYAWYIGRMLAVAWISQVGADICRELGSGTIAGYVETVGKAELLLLSLPLLEELLEMVTEVLA